MPAFRSVVSVPVSFCEDFLYELQGRPSGSVTTLMRPMASPW